VLILVKGAMMKKMILLAAVCAFSFAAQAKNFRWASQGDAATMDPQSQNETFNNGINSMVYEYLVLRGKDMSIQPQLAVSWTNPSPNRWIFKLRQGVKWHDGSPFTADDVVFSYNRARESAVTFKLYSTQAGIPKKIDDHTVEFTTDVPNPVMLETVNSIFIMSKAWCEKNNVLKPQDYTKKEETFAVRNAMGTGPYTLVTWEQGVKILHRKNPNWWGIKEGLYEGNVETVEYRPVANSATRMAALRSGQVDFVLDPPVQELARIGEDKALKVWNGPEVRVIYVGFDQARDELKYADVKGKNPFKDRRVRQALYQAIDVEALKTQVMRGLAIPTGIAFMDPKGAGVPAELDKRYPYDVAAAKKLLTEAGYPNGFGFTLSCPNDRYLNDEKLCVAIAAMWAKIGINARVDSMTKSQFFPKVQNRDASAFLAGWGGASSDAIFILKPVMRSRDGKGGGESNYGDAKNADIDQLTDKIEGEMNKPERQAMINRVVTIMHDEVHVIPLHRQMIPWTSRAGVTVVHRPNNILWLPWVKVP
jgi:peptide/nickel transport system substrate-binding protein